MAMQTTRQARPIVVATCPLAVALSVCACTSGISTPSLVATGALLTVETRGGLCVDGPCGATIVVERNGRVHQAATPPNDLGFVPPGELAALDAAISATDFTELRSHPFTGEVEVDVGSPLFLAVSTALRPFLPLPTL